MLKHISIIFASLLVSVTAFSQQTSLSTVKTQLDIMFSTLDKTKVPTGFLWDTATNLVEREDFNGTALTDSNYVSIDVMRDLLYSINSASVGADTIGVQAALARLQRNSSSSIHTVGILFQPYNYITENALIDNLIVCSNDLVSDSYIGDVWQNPYATDILFGFAIGEESSVSLNTTYNIANIDSLSTQAFQNIQFDPGDGGGYRTVTIGGNITASYIDEGCYETKLKITYCNREYLGHGLVYVYQPSSSPNHIYSPGYHYGFSYNPDFSVSFEGKTYHATVSYKLPLSFDNPLVVSEGFDPWKLAEESSFHDYQGITNIFTFKRDCHFYGDYNVFYVDWEDCGADIRVNAEVLKKVIRWVNENKTSGNKNIVLGQSMGGLIARYALRDMELKGESHDTKLFISHDVPYKGANVSPGLMYLYRDLYDMTDSIIGNLYSSFGGNKDVFNELRYLGSCTSVKQMLPNYVSPSWTYDNSVFNQFQEELASMGFPKGDPGYPIENVTIINGGNAPSGSPSLFSSGDKLVDIYLKVSSGIISELLAVWPALLLSGTASGHYELFVPGKSTLRFTYSVYPYLSNSCIVASSNLVFTKKFLWLLNKDYLLKSSSFYSPSAGVPLDAVRCSYYETPKELSDMIPYPDSGSNIWWGGYEYYVNLTDRIAFIPVASAFASSDYYQNYLTSHPAPTISTPFTSYIMPPDTTTYHTSFYDGIKSWLDKVNAGTVVGPWFPQSGDIYSLSFGSGLSYTWTTSDNSIATIDPVSREVDVTGHGVVDIIAKQEGNNYVVAKRKRVLAGLPRMILSSYNSGTQYLVQAEYVDDGVEDFLEHSGLSDSLVHAWRIMEDGVLIDTRYNYQDTISLSVNEEAKLVTVSLTITYNNNTTSPVFITIKDVRSYLWNVVQISWRGNRTMYLMNLLFGATGNPPLFMLKANPDAPNSSAVPAVLKAIAGNTVKRTYPVSFDQNYCISWDLFSDSDIQNFIAIPLQTGETENLIIEVYNNVVESSNSLVQTIIIPITPTFI